jgi:hypothetical protein
MNPKHLDGIKTCKNPLCGRLFVPEQIGQRSRPDEYCSTDCREFCRKENKKRYNSREYKLGRPEQQIRRRPKMSDPDIAEAAEAAREHALSQARLLVKTPRMEARDAVNL